MPDHQHVAWKSERAEFKIIIHPSSLRVVRVSYLSWDKNKSPVWVETLKKKHRCKLPQKTTEEDKEDDEATGSLATPKNIEVDAEIE